VDGENFTMDSSTASAPRQTLLGWLNRGDWNGRGM